MAVRRRLAPGPLFHVPSDLTHKQGLPVWHPERLEPRLLLASTDPAGYWPLDEGSGAVTADASPNGNAGTLLGGAAWSTGQNGAGTGLRLDGVDDRVSVPDSASLDVTGDITLAAWVAPAKLATQYVVKK